MKITIYYNRKYIPFDLYIQSIIYILTVSSESVKKHNVEHITDIHKLSDDTDYLILFLNDLNNIYHISYDKKIILIHADYILNHSVEFQTQFLHYVKHIHPSPIYIWEYNTLNLEYYKTQNLTNIHCSYIPLLYNPYLEHIYNKHITHRLDYKNKPIEVLFMGGISDRRKPLLEEVSKKFKIYYMECVNDFATYVDIINKSKIVVHIYAKDCNKSFDYYRSALLYSNKILYLNEESENERINPPVDLSELNNVIYKCDYNSIINRLSEILNKSEEELNIVIEQSYNEFKKLNMETLVLDFFDKQSSL
jgi:hypothetical protein